MKEIENLTKINKWKSNESIIMSMRQDLLTSKNNKIIYSDL